MKHKIFMKIIYIILTASGILLLIAIGFHVRYTEQINLKKTYVASRDILPRSKITEQDLLEIEVPDSYLQDYTFQKKEDILGKYTEIQGMIPAGSPFYKSMLFEEKELPDYPITQLREGQASFSLDIDLSSSGGLLQSGQRVDIFYNFMTKEDISIAGCLLQNVRVISIKDYKGIDIESDDSNKTPYLAILAVNEEDVSILTLAESLGKVKLITSSSSYDADKEAVLAENSPVLSYLLEKQVKPAI